MVSKPGVISHLDMYNRYYPQIVAALCAAAMLSGVKPTFRKPAKPALRLSVYLVFQVVGCDGLVPL